MSGSLEFGTSGLRGLASELAGSEARRYVAAFLAHLRDRSELGAATEVFIGRDLRVSSPTIARDCAVAVRAAGLLPVDCGRLPTPALALHAMALHSPAIMVTGSHIPPDRNGLKFYKRSGEITKADEKGIMEALVAEAPNGSPAAADGAAAAEDRYRRRYLGLLPAEALSGWRIGVFEHASVARDILVSLLYRAGARVVRLGRTEDFVAVDTEALADAVFAPRHGWIDTHQLDAIVSTDADGDRPLLIDGDGEFLRGDVVGLLAAKFLGARTVVTPITSNSAIESVGAFQRVERTRVGSPHVIAGMEGAQGPVVGFEANGGVLLGSDVTVDGRLLSALPTRDAVLPILAVLASAAAQQSSLAQLVADLPLRAALSDRLVDVPASQSAAMLHRLLNEPGFAPGFFARVGEVATISSLDGARFSLASGDSVHYRASGNAPELRCYVEGATPARAEELLRWGLEAATREVRRSGQAPS